MESGPLSAPEFPGFAKKVVPFLHVTTRIEGREHDGLLMEKGFRGFPSLAFMDAEGNVIAEPRGRSVAAFDSTLTAIGEHADLTKRIEAGETGLEAALLLAEHALGKVQGDDFKTRAEGLEKVSPEQKTKIDQILVDQEIMRLAMLPRRMGPAGLEQAAKGMLEMLEAGKRPSKQLQYAANFWITIGNWGTQELKADVVRTAAKGLAEDLPNEKAVERFVKDFNETAGKIDHHAALVKRSEGGETGLEVELLLAAYDIGATKGAEFKEQATPLLEKATAEQKTKLEAALTEVAFGEIMAGAPRGPGAVDTAGPKLAELLKAGKEPPKAMAGNVYMLVSQYARHHEDADLLEIAGNGIAKMFGDNPRAVKFADELKADAAKIRAEKAKADAEAGKGDGEDTKDGGHPDGDG